MKSKLKKNITPCSDQENNDISSKEIQVYHVLLIDH